MDAIKTRSTEEVTVEKNPNHKTWHVDCHIPGTNVDADIEARELTLNEGAYCFWVGEYGETNKMIYSFPIQYTIITLIEG